MRLSITNTYIIKNQKITVKRKYAYHYNPAGGLLGKTEFDDRHEYIRMLYQLGFRPEMIVEGAR